MLTEKLGGRLRPREVTLNNPLPGSSSKAGQQPQKVTTLRTYKLFQGTIQIISYMFIWWRFSANENTRKCSLDKSDITILYFRVVKLTQKINKYIYNLRFSRYYLIIDLNHYPNKQINMAWYLSSITIPDQTDKIMSVIFRINVVRFCWWS